MTTHFRGSDSRHWHNKPHSQFHNYIKTRWHPEHLAIFVRFQNIKYTKYKNEYVDYSEMRIPTSLGFIDIEHNVSSAFETDTIEITMVFVKSSVRYYMVNDTKETVIEHLVDESDSESESESD